MDTRLLELLVCPICKGPLHHDRDHRQLICTAERLAYPVIDGVPHLLESEARPLPADDSSAFPASDTPS